MQPLSFVLLTTVVVFTNVSFSLLPQPLLLYTEALHNGSIVFEPHSIVVRLLCTGSGSLTINLQYTQYKVEGEGAASVSLRSHISFAAVVV